jgi:hypothetical protein
MNPTTTFAFAPPDDTYQAVQGRDPATAKLKREYEAEVEHKVASDYAHIVLAYGVIWSLFVVDGIWLWRRCVRVSRDLQALERRIESR